MSNVLREKTVSPKKIYFPYTLSIEMKPLSFFDVFMCDLRVIFQ